jgi:hypothetical protein
LWGLITGFSIGMFMLLMLVITKSLVVPGDIRSLGKDVKDYSEDYIKLEMRTKYLADERNISIDEARIIVNKVGDHVFVKDEKLLSDVEKLAIRKRELDKNINNLATEHNLEEEVVFKLIKTKKDIVDDWIEEKNENTEGLNKIDALCVKFVSINWLHYEIFNFIICLIAIWLISQFTARPPAEMIKGLVYGTSTPEQVAETRASWNKWDIINTAIIIGVIILFYIYFFK